MKFLDIFKKENDRDIAARLKHAAKITMDDSSRKRMRMHLSEYTKMRPIRAQHAAHRSERDISPLFSPRIHAVPMIAALLVITISSGTVAAAENTLPGDILYSIKVHITEEVRASLTTSSKARAEYELVRAERRLEEAATLALAGDLDDVRRALIEANLTAHIASAADNELQLSESGNTSLASDIANNTEALEFARENILGERHVVTVAKVAVPEIATMSVIAESPSAPPVPTPTPKARASLREGAAPQDPAVAKQQVTSEDKSAPGHSRGNRTAAKVRIEAAKKFLDSHRELSEEARAQAEEQLKKATDIISSGDNKSSGGEKEDAASEFEHALEAATQVGTFLSSKHGGGENND